MTDTLPTISIIGGTGALGSGLAARWAGAGYPIVLGSRSSEKAVHAAQEIDTGNNASTVQGTNNKSAAAQGDIVIITVPFANHSAILQEISSVIAGKIVVDATVPLMSPKVGTVQLPTAGSAAALTQEALGEHADVVAAFHNVAAGKLRNPGPIDCDVLVCGNKKAARQTVIKLVEGLGMRGLHAGPIANSAAAEALTSVIISINRIYKADGAGIRITGDLTAPDLDST